MGTYKAKFDFKYALFLSFFLTEGYFSNLVQVPRKQKIHCLLIYYYLFFKLRK